MSEDIAAYPDGTQGHSGSATSQERAEREASDGTASRRQRTVRGYLALVRDYGATWKDLGEAFGWHHGQASSVLSVLHRSGSIARLSERRDRCHIYVLPEYVNDRPTEPHGGRPKRTSRDRVALERIELALNRADAEVTANPLGDAYDILRKTLAEVIDAMREWHQEEA